MAVWMWIVACLLLVLPLAGCAAPVHDDGCVGCPECSDCLVLDAQWYPEIVEAMHVTMMPAEGALTDGTWFGRQARDSWMFEREGDGRRVVLAIEAGFVDEDLFVGMAGSGLKVVDLHSASERIEPVVGQVLELDGTTVLVDDGRSLYLVDAQRGGKL